MMTSKDSGTEDYDNLEAAMSARQSDNQAARMKPTAAETSKVGKRGTIVMPARFRRKFGIEEGSLVIAEETEDGILIRPAVAYPIEIYTPERKAEFLLSNAVDEEDYRSAREAVREMGLDPDRIRHLHLDQLHPGKP
jgi:AbrB family looped-hinge helix DNA binding protein